MVNAVKIWGKWASSSLAWASVYRPAFLWLCWQPNKEIILSFFFAGIIFVCMCVCMCDTWLVAASQTVIKKKKSRSSKENIPREIFACFKFLE